MHTNHAIPLRTNVSRKLRKKQNTGVHTAHNGCKHRIAMFLIRCTVQTSSHSIFGHKIRHFSHKLLMIGYLTSKVRWNTKIDKLIRLYHMIKHQASVYWPTNHRSKKLTKFRLTLKPRLRPLPIRINMFLTFDCMEF